MGRCACKQHACMYVRDLVPLHMLSMHGDPTMCTVVLSPCDLSFEYLGDIMIGLACNCMNLIARAE